MKFSQEWYRLNMPPLKAAFEDGAIVLTKDADHLGDLRLVKVVRGIAQIPAERTGAQGLKRHGDFAVGLALAYRASRMRYAEYGYRGPSSSNGHGTGPGRGRDEDSIKPWHRAPVGARIRGGL